MRLLLVEEELTLGELISGSGSTMGGPGGFGGTPLAGTPSGPPQAGFTQN